MSAKSKACAGHKPPEKQQITGTITIPRAEYDALNRAAALLDIILHDHTPYHDAVPIVKNVLIDHGLLPGAGAKE